MIADLEFRAHFGVGAAVSLGADGLDAPLDLRDELPRYKSAGRGITRPEPGRNDVPHWIETAEEARAAVREEAARGVDIIKIWVDDRNGQYEKLTPELYGAVIDEAHQNGLLVAAHIFTLEDAKGLLEADVDVFAHGVRDSGCRRRIRRDGSGAPERGAHPEHARPGHADGSELPRRRIAGRPDHGPGS